MMSLNNPETLFIWMLVCENKSGNPSGFAQAISFNLAKHNMKTGETIILFEPREKEDPAPAFSMTRDRGIICIGGLEIIGPVQVIKFLQWPNGDAAWNGYLLTRKTAVKVIDFMFPSAFYTATEAISDLLEALEDDALGETRFNLIVDSI